VHLQIKYLDLLFIFKLLSTCSHDLTACEAPVNVFLVRSLFVFEEEKMLLGADAEKYQGYRYKHCQVLTHADRFGVGAH